MTEINLTQAQVKEIVADWIHSEDPRKIDAFLAKELRRWLDLDAFYSRSPNPNRFPKLCKALSDYKHLLTLADVDE